MGPAAATALSVFSASASGGAPFAVVAAVTASTTAVPAATLIKVILALVLRMGISIRGGLES
jgi:hypothetical protein